MDVTIENIDKALETIQSYYNSLKNAILHVNQCTSELKGKEQELEKSKKQHKEEVLLFEKRQKEIEDLNMRNKEVISLNVGGKKFETTKSTLCSTEGSMLSS